MIWRFWRNRNRVPDDTRCVADTVKTASPTVVPSMTDSEKPSSSDLLALFELRLFNLQLIEHGEDLEIFISDHSDWRLFEEVGAAIQSEFDGEWLARADGLDQRYWDIRIGDSVLTLHLEHYSGIMLFPEESAANRSTSRVLLEKIYRFLASHETGT